MFELVDDNAEQSNKGLIYVNKIQSQEENMFELGGDNADELSLGLVGDNDEIGIQEDTVFQLVSNKAEQSSFELIQHVGVELRSGRSSAV